jgi:peptidyl-prolyl cis-trans isomerase C
MRKGSQKMKRIQFIALALVAIMSTPAIAAVELAKIGSKTLTDVDMKNLMGPIPDGQKQQINSDDEIKARMVDNMVVEELFVMEAERTGVTRDKEFQLALDRARRQLLTQRYLQRTVQPKITDANVKAFFDKNKSRYSQDEVKASHVLLKTEAEAKEVYAKAKAGEDFEVLAKKFSKDPSVAQNMGDLGFFTRSRMVPQFADAAFAMKAGEISQPVKSPFGFHIIKVVEKKAGKPVKFDEVKEQVRGDLQNESINDLIAGLKKNHKVTIFEDKVKTLKF